MTTHSAQLSLLPSCASPLKWCGSKAWLAPRLSQEILPRLTRVPGYSTHTPVYHELFTGSAAVFFVLRSRGYTGEAVLSDKLSPLIRLYQALRSHPVNLCAEIHALLSPEQELSDVEHEAYYYLVRNQYNQDLAQNSTELAASARFLWLNYRGFNGLYRTNRRGEYTVAYGGRRLYFPSVEQILDASRALQNTTCVAMDFENLPDPAPGDVVFADPPYDGTYTGYAGGFSAEDQARLATRLRTLSERGVHVFATNADTPLVRSLYSWATFEVLSTKYVIGGERKQVAEVLIRGER